MAGARFQTHPAVRGFDRAAARYERGRPDYPPAAVAALARALHLGPATTVVELGSGTGKFTRALAPVGAARVAVEPIEGMRRVFRQVVPDVPVIPGTAEAIPLPAGFADAVVAAQAFHWFRPRPTLREVARVLRPGGGVGLVWNLRDESVRWSHRLTEILDAYGYARAVPRARGHERWRPVFEAPDSPFGPLHRRTFSFVQRAPRATFVDRVLSVSVVAGLPAGEQRRVAARVREVLDRDPLTRGRAVLAMPYRTDVFWAYRKRGRSPSS